MGRRDSTDERWIETKDIVHKRDKGRCRLARIVSAREMLVLRKHAGSKLSRIDAAHFLPVSERPDLCYDPNNICSLNRYSHEMLDSFRDPVTGASISKEDVLDWWIRIIAANKQQYSYLVSKQLLEE